MKYRIPLYKCRLVRCKAIDLDLPEREVGYHEQAARLFQALTRDEPSEVFLVACLGGQNQILGVEVVGRGGLHGAAVTPREVFRLAYLRNASAIVIGHNHPSGDPKPSQEDLILTRQIAKAGEAIGIPLLDHVIVARASSTSLLELGVLSQAPAWKEKECDQ